MENREPLLKAGQTIVFDGDSITCRRRGPSLDTWPLLDLLNWRQTYADEIGRLVFCLRPDLGLDFRNAAVGGSTSSAMLERFDRFVLPHEPDWVVLTVGGNDCARGMPPDEFAGNMRRYAGRVRDECGGRVCILGGFRHLPGQPEELRAKYEPRPPYYEALRRIAAEADGLYVDVGKPLLEKARLLYGQSSYHVVHSDGSHLNALGNLIVAGEVLAALGFRWGDLGG